MVDVKYHSAPLCTAAVLPIDAKEIGMCEQSLSFVSYNFVIGKSLHRSLIYNFASDLRCTVGSQLQSACQA